MFQIFWSGSGTLVIITSEDSYYVLKFDRDAYNEKIEAGADLGDEGVEEAFDLVAEIPEKYITRPPHRSLITDPPQRSNWSMGRRLLPLYHINQQAELLCGKRILHCQPTR